MQRIIDKIIDILSLIPILIIVLFIILADTVKVIIEFLPFVCFIFLPTFIIGYLLNCNVIIGVIWFVYVFLCICRASLLFIDNYKFI